MMWNNISSAASSRRPSGGWKPPEMLILDCGLLNEARGFISAFSAQHSAFRGSVMNRLRTYASFVRFSHSVFALPFALTGALLALNETGRWALAEVGPRVAWIVV